MYILIYLYIYIRINIYSNIFIPKHTSSEYVPPREGKDGRLYVYTKTHLAPANNHALFYAPPSPWDTSAVIALGYSSGTPNQEHAPRPLSLG